jgi:pyruvate dehydrogenase E1 component alpha subunit
MNMAVVLKLPVIFVFENNHYGEHTGADYAVGAQSIAQRAAGFGMLARKADGCDFFATFDALHEIVAHCRAGEGPAAIELDTERFYGHFEGDPQRYRGDGEISRLRETRDCLKRFRERTASSRSIQPSALDQIDAEVARLIDAAVSEARAAPPPRAEDVLEDVYVTY